MAEKRFGVKQINFIGTSGTPTINSPNNLNLQANTVAISTNVTVGGNLSVTGISTFNNVTISGLTTTSQLYVTGVSTFSSRLDVSEAVYLGTVGGNAEFRISRFGGKNTFESTSGPFEFTGNGGQVNLVNQNLNITGLNGPVVTTTAAGLVGIGSTTPEYLLSIGPIGAAGTSLLVNGGANIYGMNIDSKGTRNTNIGYLAGQKLVVTASQNVAIGYESLFNNISGSNNVALGYNSLRNATSGDNTAVGNQSGSSITGGQGNTLVGNQSGSSIQNANNNTFLGNGSGNSVTNGSNNIILGSYSGNASGLDIRSSSNNVIISDGSGNVRIYANSNGNVGIATINPTSRLTVSGDAIISGVITATTFVGNFTGSITDATNLTGGYAVASRLNVSGITTISQGRIQADASANLRFGNLPVGSGSVGRNIAIGDQVLPSLSGGQGRNIALGELSYFDTTTGQYNIGIGVRAGEKITSGSNNVILGGYNGNSGGLDLRTSSNNVVIADGEGNIRQYINSLGNVGIKTTVVTEALTVAGIVSATSFYGTLNASQLTGALPAIDGSALIGVVATGTGVEIRDDNTIVGTAATINFGSNLNVNFAAGIATVSVGNSVSFATTAYTLTGSPNVTLGRVLAGVATFRSGTFDVTDLNGSIGGQATVRVGGSALLVGESSGTSLISGFLNAPVKLMSSAYVELEDFYGTTKYARFSATSTYLNYNNSRRFETTGYGITVYGGITASGIITASSFVGSGSNLTNLPSGQLTGALPALDGSALINLPAQPGDGINVSDDNSPVGSARTVNFGTGLDVAISGGIATITASGGSLQSRTTVTGVTTSIPNNGIGNTNITGFKSYALMRVGLSTAGWLRLYTDSTSRANDVSRSRGEDPAPGSGVIAEVVTTGISTTQIISPFVMGGNLDNPADTTIYASITNLSGSTQTITANLTILQLEA